MPDHVDESVDEPELTTDIERVAADQITIRIAEDFAGHALATLITALLTTEGFLCTQSPPGPDGGIDITARPDVDRSAWTPRFYWRKSSLVDRSAHRSWRNCTGL
jgi:hypothetical protein